MKAASRRPRFLEFFAGAGLVRQALEPAWECVWANDFSAKKAEVYRANHGGERLVEADVTAIDAATLPDAELAWASFPCQDLSLAGWRRGMSAARSGTFWAFWRLMKQLDAQGRRPPVVAIENVVGLLYGDNFGGLCEALAGLGMRFGAMVLDAKWFLPQSRPRVFVAAVDGSVPLGGRLVEAPTGEPWFPPAVVRAAEALPADLRAGWTWWKLAPPAAPPSAVFDVIDPEAAAGSWRSAAEVERLLGMMTETNRRKVEQRRGGGEISVGFLYRRMREGKQRPEVRFDIAGCLRTPAGGSSRQTVVLAGRGEVRMRLLAPREAAALMGVPREWRLPENDNDAHRAMGDGVAVPVVRWLSEELLLPLARTPRGARTAEPGPNALAGIHAERAGERASEWLRRAGPPERQLGPNGER